MQLNYRTAENAAALLFAPGKKNAALENEMKRADRAKRSN
jgi:hypothetical protein